MPDPGPPPDPDTDLIRRWQGGDRAAFEGLVRAWQGPVARFLARLTGSADQARDLTQDVFLRVYLSAGKYRDDGRFSAWLFRVAVNLARDAARRTSRRPVAALPETEPPSPGPSADGQFEDRERAAGVAAALAELSPPLREVVLLRHYEDMSFEEMARLLGTPASTLKSRFTVALRQLQERLTANGFAPEDCHDL
ncbi:RNA polymerase sigma factor [Fimbriiglobus ruber]|nr:sigma-70 family RNA polymerase sigma factor [Fimbriiglobus ruber]